MTPFGLKMRELRRQHNRTQQQQAKFLGVSKAYISALETGGRGQPSAIFVDQICVWLGLIWDDAEVINAVARSRENVNICFIVDSYIENNMGKYITAKVEVSSSTGRTYTDFLGFFSIILKALFAKSI